jgi:cellulose synthase/poly-beta-1,6-N-acetylglucosamine synthase-like glycosyltransferase
MYWLIIPVAVYSLGIFILWLILWGKRDHSPSAAGALPMVTVVVAARNEEKNIANLLECLVAQDYPSGLLEILIVNDNSTDRTPIVVSELIAKNKLQSLTVMKLIYNPFSGKKRAIRHGVEKASGELILTTDADCTVGPGWVSTHAGDGRAGSADLIVGEVYQRPAKGFAALFGRFEFSALQAITGAAVLAGYPVMCSAASMSFRREVYLRHAGELRDDLPSGDDIFLLHAVKRAGGRIGYAAGSAAAAETAGAVTAAALLRQRARWASKTLHYNDAATLTLAAATAACNAAVAAAAVASVISVEHIPLLAGLYGLRMVPDYLITAHNIKKREGKMSLAPFVLSELIYPFYFMAVGVMSLFPAAHRFRKR